MNTVFIHNKYYSKAQDRYLGIVTKLISIAFAVSPVVNVSHEFMKNVIYLVVQFLAQQSVMQTLQP
jgi:hypothetical protein